MISFGRWIREGTDFDVKYRLIVSIMYDQHISILHKWIQYSNAQQSTADEYYRKINDNFEINLKAFVRLKSVLPDERIHSNQ